MERTEDERMAEFLGRSFDGETEVQRHRRQQASLMDGERAAAKFVDADVQRQAGSREWKSGKIRRCPECYVIRGVFHEIGCSLAGSAQPEVVERPTLPEHAGMYRHPVDGRIWKVQVAVHGSGYLYAKLLEVPGEGEDFTPYFEMDRGAIFKIELSWRMTIEEAKQFGALYGTCCVCARTLTKEESIAAGIGPVCATKV